MSGTIPQLLIPSTLASQKTVSQYHVATPIIMIHKGVYNTIAPLSIKRTLKDGFKNVIINQIYIFPDECLEGWELAENCINHNMEMQIDDECVPILVRELTDPGTIAKSTTVWSKLIDLNWPAITNIIIHHAFKNDPKDLDELANNLLVCIKNNLEPKFNINGLVNRPQQSTIEAQHFFNTRTHNASSAFNMEIQSASNIKIQKEVTNDDIYAALIDKIPVDYLLKYIADIRRANPTIQNTMMHNLPNMEFNDVSGRDLQKFYHSRDIKRYPTGRIKSQIEGAYEIFNAKTNNLAEILKTSIDGVNAVISGGSVIKSITDRTYKDHDIDIFTNSVGYINCIKDLTKHYGEENTQIIVFNSAISCINVLIVGQKLNIQFIITDHPLLWIIGGNIRQGFDFEHLKIIIASGRLYCSYNAFRCLKNLQTYISSDIKGCVYPHRLNKAIKIFPVERNQIIDEFSDHLVHSENLSRDYRYIYVDKNDDIYHTTYIVKKVFNVKSNIYFIYTDDIVKHVHKIINADSDFSAGQTVIAQTFDEFIMNIITATKYAPKSKVENTTVNAPTKIETFDDYASTIMSVKYSPYFRIYCGIIPPVKIYKVIKIRNSYHEKFSIYLVITPLRLGPVISRVFKENKYLLIDVDTGDDFRSGNIIYCNLENTYSITRKTIKMDDDEKEFTLLKALWVIRYSELENNNN